MWKYYYQNIAGTEGNDIVFYDGTHIDGRGGNIVIWVFPNPPGPHENAKEHIYVSDIPTDSVLPFLRTNDFVAASIMPDGKLKGLSVLCYFNP